MGHAASQILGGSPIQPYRNSMDVRFAISSALAFCLTLASGAEPGWVEISAKPRDWPDSLPLLTERRSAFVLDMPSASFVRGFAVPSPRKPALNEVGIREQVGGLLEKMPWQEKVELKIDWLMGEEQPVDFTRSFLPENGIVRSSYRLGGAKITRTVIADETESAIFIHLISDKPGALSFRVILSVSGEGEPKIEDRRQLVRAADASVPGSLGAHVWVLPFESDVAPDGNSIVVRGEGEALVILTFAAGSDATHSLAETLTRLGNRFDPGHSPADPTKIWQGVLAGHLKSVENSP